MVSGIRDLVLYPDAFFERVSKEEISILPPFLIVFAGALVFDIVILLFFVWNRTGWCLFNLGPGSLIAYVIFSLACWALVLPFIFWAVATVIFYGISRAFGGTGSFLMMVQNIGYGMLPWSMSAVVPLAVFIHKFFTFPGNPVSGGYSGIWMMPAGFSILPLILILIWSGFLWVPAVQHAHGFTRSKAMAIVWIPVIIHILLILPSIAWLWYL